MPSNNKGYNKANVNKGNNQKYLRHIMSSDPFNPKTIDLSDPVQVQAQIEWYFNSCINDDMKPSLSGLARCLGCDLETMRRWTNGERRSGQPHGGLIKKAREIVQEMYVQYMTNGELNPVAGIFLMGNDFDYERESGTTVNNVQITQTISPQQLEDKYSTIIDGDYQEVQEPKLLPPEE